MPADFDAYHKWLGISPRERPPTYYRLLAIDLFEDDPDVIDSAANRQMNYLQDLASGPNVKKAQKLLNEISAARLCLLDAKSKANYDARLNAKVSEDRPALAAPLAAADTAVSYRPAVGKSPSPKPTAPKPAARLENSTATPPSFSPVVDIAPRDEPSRRTIKRRKKPANGLVLGLLGAAAIIIAVSAVFVSGALRPNDVSTSPEDVAARDRDVAPGTNDNELPEPGVVTDRTNPRQDSDIGAPGGDSVPDQAQDRDPTPPEKPPTPPPSENAAAQKPDALVRAEAALDGGDVAQMIVLLKECLANSPPDPWRSQAQELLRQATTVTNSEAIAKAARQTVNKLSDDQARAIDKGKPHQWMVQLPFNTSQITDPRLKKVLDQDIRHHLLLAMAERMNGGPRKDPPVNPPKEDPEPELATKEEPAPEVDDPDVPVVADERPTDPAKLLAYVGLARSGQRWSLTAEDPLREDLQQASVLYKQLNDARRQISPQDRQRLAILKKQVNEEDQKNQAKRQAWNGKSVPQADFLQLKKNEEKVEQGRTKVDAAEAKVSEVDQSILQTREELEKILVVIEETLDTLQVNYEVLAEDAEVLAAIKSQGGTLQSSSALKAFRSRLQRMQKDLDESAP